MDATALIAEDEPLLADELERELAQAWPGLRIAGRAAHGAAAVENALHLRPDVLFLDIRMPGMTGLALQQDLAAMYPRLPIVMITGHGSEAIRQRALDAGAVAVLDKPFSDQALLDALTDALAPHG